MAARVLDIGLATLYRKLKEYNLAWAVSALPSLASMAAHRYSRLVNNPCFGTLEGRLCTDSGRELATHVTEDSGVH